jgi:hypothetical protein
MSYQYDIKHYNQEMYKTQNIKVLLGYLKELKEFFEKNIIETVIQCCCVCKQQTPKLSKYITYFNFEESPEYMYFCNKDTCHDIEKQYNKLIKKIEEYKNVKLTYFDYITNIKVDSVIYLKNNSIFLRAFFCNEYTFRVCIFYNVGVYTVSAFVDVNDLLKLNK